jgi:hypothetical protein
VGEVGVALEQEGGDLLVGHPDDPGQHQEQRRLGVAGGQGGLDLLDRAGGIGDAEPGLVEDEVVDGVRQGAPPMAQPAP